MYHGPIALECGELSVDFIRRSVRARSVLVPLTHRQWEFVEALAMCSGFAVSRDYLLACLHPRVRARPNIRSIDVVASQVRKKLGAILGCNYVHSVRDLGYALRPPG